MNKDPRNKNYKRLQSRVRSNKKRSYNFDDTLARVTQSLWPQRKGAPSSSGGSAALDEIQANFNNRLALMDKENAKRLESVRQENEANTAATKEQADKESRKNLGINKGLHKAIQRLYADKQREAQSASQPATPTEATEQDITSELSYTPPTITPAENTTEEPITGIVTEGETVKSVVKAVLDIGQKVPIGNNSYRITNLFGPRTGKNAVKGRGPGHSRGVDVVTHDAAGKKTNAPIAIADGVIKSISLEGTGKSINTTSGTSGGYVMNVELPNGKIVRYMHLSPDIEAQRSSLIGKPIKRGEVLFEGDHSIGSGSGTNNHTKISISNMDEQGNLLKDHDNPENDPTPYILYGNSGISNIN
jgi:hypothetical protein